MLAALSSVGFWTTFFVYAMEMVGGKWKAILGIGFEFPWAVAYSILPGNKFTGHQAVVRQSSGSRQAVFRQSSGSGQAVVRQS